MSKRIDKINGLGRNTGVDSFPDGSKTVNHWGKWVDSETPITGVIQNNNIVQFISDATMYSSKAINLSYEEYSQEMAKHYGKRSKAYREALEEYEGDNDTYLIGDWKKDRQGKYYPDKHGEYAAIVREDVTQVIFSKYTTRSALCSPCYPGQADNDTPGEFLAYTLPPSAFEEY